MWYFTWILGAGLAVGFGILNGMWHEFHLGEADDAGPLGLRLATVSPGLIGAAAFAAPGAATGGQRRPAVQAASTQALRDGTIVRIRRIQASDAPLEREFIEGLSAQSRRFRFLDTLKSPGDALLHKLTSIDPASDDAFIAVVDLAGEEREVGVARFSAKSDGTDCEFAVTVSDAWQGKGLGRLLMQRLIESARSRGIRAMHSSDASDNDLMRRFAQHLGLRHERDPDDAMQVLYTLDLEAP
jgi:cyd operon protein YbgT